MSKSPYLMGDSMIKYSYKPKDDHHHHSHKAKGITFLASIFSFFIFMTSTMYVLNNTSYTTLFNNNIFWFFMSNTLILFIAADYEAFSSSKNNTKQDHYVRHTQEAGQAGEDQMYAALPLQAETVTSKSRDNSLTVAPRVTLKASRNINKYNHIIDHEEQVHEKSMVIPNYSPPKKQRPISESTPEERVLEIVVQNNNKDDDEQKNERSKLGRDEEMKRPIYPGGRAVGRRIGGKIALLAPVSIGGFLRRDGGPTREVSPMVEKDSH
ncbi:putative transmembrane protein [Senna tora]|uniref:Putative transmembrane protein n=1 Tax=Senna tora TaxID=362788 RepID=A0A834W278_9FABA|nr:putative transmembrane protein [Senna tora]